MERRCSVKILGIGGEPATGKTTLVRKLISKLSGPQNVFKFGLLRGHHYKDEKLFILGVYDGVDNSGSDRLSVSVLKDAENFMNQAISTNPYYSVIFEGDRLFNKCFLSFCDNLQAKTRYIVLTCERSVIDYRYAQKQKPISKSWLIAKASKIKNICIRSGVKIELMENDQPYQLDQNSDDILKWLRS